MDGHRYCDTLYGCYLVTLGYGLRSGGGVADIFTTHVGRRWLLDVSFFLVITLGMLNLIAGVIITTFGQLRENTKRRMEDTENICFICGIHKQIFDRASNEPDGFKTHIKVDHNMWNYLYFIFLLWEQDKDDDDGLEQYVRRAIDANEIVWFPMNKAIRLDQAASKEESLLADLKKSIHDTEENVGARLDKFQTDILIVLETLNQTLKQDFVPESDSTTRLASAGGSLRSDRARNKLVDSGGADRAVPAGMRALTEYIPGTRTDKVLYLEVHSIEGVHHAAASPDYISLSAIFGDDEHILPAGEFTRSSDHEVISFRKGDNIVKLGDMQSVNRNQKLLLSLIVESARDQDAEPTVIPLLDCPVEQLLLGEHTIMQQYFSIFGQSNLCRIEMFPFLDKT